VPIPRGLEQLSHDLAAPIPMTTRMPKAGFHFVPRPCASFDTISHAPIIGARP
jgi:hypothetical protein